MRYWLDTEYKDDGSTIHLLSVGLVAEDGREFYGVSTDFPLEIADDWHRRNTLPLLPATADAAWMTRRELRERLVAFVGDTQPEFWAMCSPWDWFLVVRLFGRVEDLPHGWPMVCWDLWQLEDELGCTCRPAHPGPMHHALADARWHRSVYLHLRRDHAG